jgi:hypothetical protein
MHKRVLGAVKNESEEYKDGGIPVRIGRSYEVIEATNEEPWRGTALTDATVTLVLLG